MSDFVDVAYLVVWLGIFCLLAFANSRRRQAGFLVNAYLLNLLLIHWFGALVHSLPWKPFIDSSNTVAGFQETTYGLIAFALGTFVVPRLPFDPVVAPTAMLAHGTAQLRYEVRSISRLYIGVGIASWLLSHTAISALPSASSILSAGKQGLLLAICLQCWLAYHERDRRSLLRWMSVALAFPVVTILSQGFIGYGIAMLLTVLAFVAVFYRPRRHLVVGGLVAGYLGLSLWVAYAEHREAIRAAVWGGQDMLSRIEAGINMLASIKGFDITKPEHLHSVDIRLNQNELVGAALRYTPHFEPFQYGATLFDALIALIPRALWPDKPITAGSGDYVSRHTGIEFAAGTSVGMGQTLEFYINFGTAGVVAGFFLLGMALRRMDDYTFRALSRRNWHTLTFWFMVGCSALQPGGAVGEITMSMAAAAVMTIAGASILRSGWLQRRRVRAQGAGSPRTPRR